MFAGAVVLTLFLAQVDEVPPPPPPSGVAPVEAPPPPVSPPPLLSAPDGPPPPQPGPLPQRLPDSPPGTPRAEPPPEGGDEGPPGTPTAWWKRSLATLGVGIGAGGLLGAGVAVFFWQLTCPNFCTGTDLFGMFAIAGLTAMFTIPAAVSIVGRALGGRAKYGYALIGSALFGAVGLIVSLAMTGGADVPIVAIPVFSTLMVVGSVASFELFSLLKEPKKKATAEPVVALVPGGGMLGMRATF